MQFVGRLTLILALMAVTTIPLHAASDSQADSGEGSGQSWSETMESLKSYGAEQRDRALQAGKSTLEAMDKRIEELEGWTEEQWDSLSAETREERTAALERMRKQRNEVAEWYGGMKHSSAEAWDSVKQGFIDSYGELREAYNEAADWMKSGSGEDSSE